MKRPTSWAVLVSPIVSLLIFGKGARPQDFTSHTFNPNDIQILTNLDIDIVYHVLAHFSLPGDSSNLYSSEYVNLIRKAKEDLGVGPTKLDSLRTQLEQTYRQYPRLRFLNLAPFMADDYASFKQALLMIDYNVEKEKPEDSREASEVRKAQGQPPPLLFGNAKRLIPLYRKRFPDAAEQQFVKQFAESMDDEQARFYKLYREARSEIDQQSLEEFLEFWKTDGSRILWPWAEKSRVNVFNIYLSPVMKSNGRGVPVNQEQSVLFNIVAPLPEKRDQTLQSVFVILHETTHRLTDRLAESAQSPTQTGQSASENLAFYADHLYLKTNYSRYHSSYLKFFLNLEVSKQFDVAFLEGEFLKSYPVSPAEMRLVAELVKGL
jgi:hypothetical protein